MASFRIFTQAPRHCRTPSVYATFGLILTPTEDGRMSAQIDTHGLPLNSYVIHSAEGTFTGDAAGIRLPGNARK